MRAAAMPAPSRFGEIGRDGTFQLRSLILCAPDLPAAMATCRTRNNYFLSALRRRSRDRARLHRVIATSSSSGRRRSPTWVSASRDSTWRAASSDKPPGQARPAFARPAGLPGGVDDLADDTTAAARIPIRTTRWDSVSTRVRALPRRTTDVSVSDRPAHAGRLVRCRARCFVVAGRALDSALLTRARGARAFSAARPGGAPALAASS